MAKNVVALTIHVRASPFVERASPLGLQKNRLRITAKYLVRRPSDTPLSRAANCYKSTRSNAETAEKRKQNSKPGQLTQTNTGNSAE
jgi:hypothetical protein